MDAALRAEDRDPATLRRTVGMDADRPGDLAGVIDAYERLGIDDLIIRLAPGTRDALDRLASALGSRGH